MAVALRVSSSLPELRRQRGVASGVPPVPGAQSPPPPPVAVPSPPPPAGRHAAAAVGSPGGRGALQRKALSQPTLAPSSPSPASRNSASPVAAPLPPIGESSGSRPPLPSKAQSQAAAFAAIAEAFQPLPRRAHGPVSVYKRNAKRKELEDVLEGMRRPTRECHGLHAGPWQASVDRMRAAGSRRKGCVDNRPVPSWNFRYGGGGVGNDGLFGDAPGTPSAAAPPTTAASGRTGIPEAVEGRMRVRRRDREVIAVAPHIASGGSSGSKSVPCSGATSARSSGAAGNVVVGGVPSQQRKPADLVRSVKAQTCVCGSVFLADSLFCRMCGVKRPEVSRDAAKAGACGSSPQQPRGGCAGRASRVCGDPKQMANDASEESVPAETPGCAGAAVPQVIVEAYGDNVLEDDGAAVRKTEEPMPEPTPQGPRAEVDDVQLSASNASETCRQATSVRKDCDLVTALQTHDGEEQLHSPFGSWQERHEQGYHDPAALGTLELSRETHHDGEEQLYSSSAHHTPRPQELDVAPECSVQEGTDLLLSATVQPCAEEATSAAETNCREDEELSVNADADPYGEAEFEKSVFDDDIEPEAVSSAPASRETGHESDSAPKDLAQADADYLAESFEKSFAADEFEVEAAAGVPSHSEIVHAADRAPEDDAQKDADAVTASYEELHRTGEVIKASVAPRDCAQNVMSRPPSREEGMASSWMANIDSDPPASTKHASESPANVQCEGMRTSDGSPVSTELEIRSQDGDGTDANIHENVVDVSDGKSVFDEPEGVEPVYSGGEGCATNAEDVIDGSDGKSVFDEPEVVEPMYSGGDSNAMNADEEQSCHDGTEQEGEEENSYEESFESLYEDEFEEEDDDEDDEDDDSD